MFQMQRYICSVCGFIYDEAAGYAGGSISPGTKWFDVPSSFSCPLCGAPKSAFYKEEKNGDKLDKSAASDSIPEVDDVIDYTSAELAALFSNLAKGCEKQYKPEMSGLYMELAAYYEKKSGRMDGSGFDVMIELLKKDLETGYAYANDVAGSESDRGALRALKWSEQVSKMINAHLRRLESGVPSFAEDTSIFVCDICGFVFIGDKKPEICPICKVPNMKMTMVQRRSR